MKDYNRPVPNAHSYEALSSLGPRQIRELCRTGQLSGPTAGLAPGFEQANLVILPEASAADFRRFCELNAGPCPLLEMTAVNVFEPRCAPGADLRTDLPRYHVYRGGELVDNPTNVMRWCNDDGSGGSHIAKSPHHQITSWASFLLGCSFTFEAALLRAGIPVRHIEQKCNVPMYRTNIQCAPSRDFHGPMVVSMRPMSPAQARRAGIITAQLPRAHGAPIHVGNPREIGIASIDRPDYGDPVEIREGEVPVFWACGVTPLEAILRAKPDMAIVHEPGHMFITDIASECGDTS